MLEWLMKFKRAYSTRDHYQSTISNNDTSLTALIH